MSPQPVSPRSSAPSWTSPRPAQWPSVGSPPAVPISRGASGPAVEWLQRRLVAYGYLPASLIGSKSAGFGNFGPLSETRLSSFQAWNGLPATGIADGPTLAALARAPSTSRSGAALLEGGVRLDGLSEASMLAYLRRVYDLNNPGKVPFNSQPGGVNFIQIRGFLDRAAVQNIPNRYNDTMFALINGPDGKPASLQTLASTADFGNLDSELAQGYGAPRPNDPALGPVMGEQSNLDRGLVMSASGRVVNYIYGRHVAGATSVDRGIGLLDPKDRNGVRAYVDYNHNAQIDGFEWNHLYPGAVGNNVHRGGDASEVGPWSAGCHPLPVNGEYQRFVDIVTRSAQVQGYIQSLVDRGYSRANAEAQVLGERRTDGVVDSQGRGVLMGPTAYKLPAIRFPFLLVDSRALPEPG